METQTTFTTQDLVDLFQAEADKIGFHCQYDWKGFIEKARSLGHTDEELAEHLHRIEDDAIYWGDYAIEEPVAYCTHADTDCFDVCYQCGEQVGTRRSRRRSYGW